MIGAFIFLAQAGGSFFGIRSEENPKHEVLVKEGKKEIRLYAPYITATTRVTGYFKDSMNSAFRILASYIFGENERRQKISMTAPVVASSPSEKIKMTSPVVQAKVENGWQMSFMMPSKYTLEDLPQPKDPRVELVEVPAKMIAVIRYSGLWSEERNQKFARELRDWLVKRGTFEPVSQPMFAGYDPPWTIPFLRKNEAMIEVRKL